MLTLNPIGCVRSARTDTRDDQWGNELSRIELLDSFPSGSLAGLEEFSQVEILFFFHLVPEQEIVSGARHPRGNPQWPQIGIFAQRGKGRPNRIGASIARVLGVKDRTLTLQGLDAIDGTPVLDIKPVFAEFLPREPIRQPQWSHEIMAHYWQCPSSIDAWSLSR